MQALQMTRSSWDPGVGFGKTYEMNLETLTGWKS